MKTKYLALALALALSLCGCSSATSGSASTTYDNEDQALELNKEYTYDLDNNGTDDTFEITVDSDAVTLTMNGRDAVYHNSYDNVEARLLRLENGQYLVGLTLAKGDYDGVTDFYGLKKKNMHRKLHSLTYKNAGRFTEYSVKGNTITATLCLHDPQLDWVSLPMTFTYNDSKKRLVKDSGEETLTYLTKSNTKTHKAAVTLAVLKEARTTSETAFTVKEGEELTISKARLVGKTLYYTVTKGENSGFLKSMSAQVTEYFSDITKTE